MKMKKNIVKIATHIPLYIDNDAKKKVIQIKKLIFEFFKISPNVKIYIHTNKRGLNLKKNRRVKILYHNLKNVNPHKLTWKCRLLMKKQNKKFDIFIYSEDDILFTKKNFNYWLKFKDVCIKSNYNLGFLRTEKKIKSKILFSSDLTRKIDSYISIKKIKFAVNNINPYCAFWIYDKDEFNKFIQTKYWNFQWKGFSAYAHYYPREMSAIGWHGKNMNRYLSTIIPLKKNQLDGGCFIKHLSNKYSNNPVLNKYSKNRKEYFGSIKIDALINKKLKQFKNINPFKKEWDELKYSVYNKLRFNKRKLIKSFIFLEKKHFL